MKPILILAAVGAFSLIAILSVLGPRDSDFLADADLEGLSTREMVDELERGRPDPGRFMATVDSEQLVLRTQEETRVFSLPEGRFYLSFAPYIEETHPCTVHNLSTCQGEMAAKTFDLVVEDDEGIQLEKTVTTHENGFYGIWLPKGETFTIRITKGDRYAEETVSTFAGDNTCLTTMALE